MSRLAVLEGIQTQGEGTDDARAWIIDVSNQTTDPTSPTVPRVIDLSTGKDVSSTVMPSGSASVSGNYITLPLLTALTPEHTYKVYVSWTDGSETKSTVFYVFCEPRRE